MRAISDENFAALARDCGLSHVRDVNAFISKVMVFDKSAARGRRRKGVRR